MDVCLYADSLRWKSLVPCLWYTWHAICSDADENWLQIENPDSTGAANHVYWQVTKTVNVVPNLPPVLYLGITVVVMAGAGQIRNAALYRMAWNHMPWQHKNAHSTGEILDRKGTQIPVIKSTQDLPGTHL